MAAENAGRPPGGIRQAAAVQASGYQRREERSDSIAISSPQLSDFLRRRLGQAIERGDNQTAGRLRAQLDRLLNP
jgi:hypothetical protein